MTKDVLLSIRGLQFVSQEEEEVEPVEVITAGDYYKKNGKHYIMYDEVTEGFDGNTRNVIKLTEDSLDITKKGISNVHMVFEKNKKNVSYYNTPFGSLLIGIDAKSVDIAETEDDIDQCHPRFLRCPRFLRQYRSEGCQKAYYNKKHFSCFSQTPYVHWRYPSW